MDKDTIYISDGPAQAEQCYALVNNPIVFSGVYKMSQKLARATKAVSELRQVANPNNDVMHAESFPKIQSITCMPLC